MHIVIASDAWRPQVNGVVRSLENMAAHAAGFGARVHFITPDQFRTLPMPGYPEIRLALTTGRAMQRRLAALQPDYVHIATEGPVGRAVRAACLATGRPFTTSYHTRFPEYVAARMPAPEGLIYGLLRRFHNSGAGVMVSTPSLARELQGRGFRHVMHWSRGVDGVLFRPRRKGLPGLAGPLFLYVGRVAVEKNLDAFLSLDLPGTKVIVGDGPARAELARAWPDACFPGVLTGEALAEVYAACDVFVFPSRTDTFGIVLLEALASGLPVAAFPVTGPRDVIGDSGAGALDEDLRAAALRALRVDPALCRAWGERFTWRASAGQFFNNIIAAHAAVESGPQDAPGLRDASGSQERRPPFPLMLAPDQDGRSPWP